MTGLGSEGAGQSTAAGFSELRRYYEVNHFNNSISAHRAARMALNTSAVLVSCRPCPEVTVVSLLAGRREAQAAWTFALAER
jgi:hypothetical protein